MKNLLPLIFWMLSLAQATAQPGFTKYKPYGTVTGKPSGFHAHDTFLYFSAINPTDKTPDLWRANGSMIKHRAIASDNYYPFFRIIGGNEDSLIMLVVSKPVKPHAEGIFAYNVKNDSLYLKHTQTGLLNNNIDYGFLMSENDTAYYRAKTATGQAIFRYDIKNGRRDTFCYLPGDVVGALLYHIDTTYYLSLGRIVSNAPVAHIHIIETEKKQLSVQPVTLQSNPAGITEIAHNNADIYFAGYDTLTGIELYKYADGQTIRLTDINTNKNLDNGASLLAPYSIVAYNNRIYFGATDGIQKRSLYEYDIATSKVKRIYSHPIQSIAFNPTDFYVFNSRLYMFAVPAKGSVSNPHVYSGADTPLLLDYIQPPGGPFGPYTSTYRNYSQYKGDMYFTAADTFGVVQVYRFRDTHLGTPPPNGIFELVTQISVSARPNPIVQDVQLDISVNKPVNLSLRLTDMHGKAVYTQKDKQYTEGMHLITIPMRQLPAGMYVYTLSDISIGEVYCGKLLKQ